MFGLKGLGSDFMMIHQAAAATVMEVDNPLFVEQGLPSSNGRHPLS